MRLIKGGFGIYQKLSLAILLAFAFLMIVSGCSVSPAEGKLQVMYTGNIRGNVSPCGCKISKGGVARLANFVERHRDPSVNWLMVDAGNFVDRAGAQGGCSNKCQFLVTSYEDLNYDVLNIARQEISMGYETLKALRDTSEDVEFVSANLIEVKSGRPMFKPYVIKDYGNMKVGIMGLLRDADYPPTVATLDTNVLRVTSTREAAERYLNELKSKVNAIVLLCELPSDDLDSLLAKYPEVDFAISTGALRTGETTTFVNKTRVTSPGSSGYNGHYATLEFNPAWGDSVGFSDFKDALTDTYEQPGPWLDRLAAFEEINGTAKQPKTPAGTGTTIQVPSTPATLSPKSNPREARMSLSLNNMNQSDRLNRPLRALTGTLVVLGLLSLSQMFAATKQADKQAAKHAQARVLYSGSFRGHVEPCG